MITLGTYIAYNDFGLKSVDETIPIPGSSFGDVKLGSDYSSPQALFTRDLLLDMSGWQAARSS